MNKRNQGWDDDVLDRSLRARIARTSAGLESRFRERKAGLVRARAEAGTVMPFPFFAYLVRFGAAAAIVLAAGGLWFRAGTDRTESRAGDLAAAPVYLEDPFAWDEALAPAKPILDEEIREAIYHFSYEDNS